MEQAGLPSIAELSQPELRIAGMRINPRTNGMNRTRPYAGLKLMNIENGTESTITGMPDDPRVLNVSWSPDGKHVAFTLTRDTGIELWVVDPETGRAKRVSDAQLNGNYRGSP
jgi:Tol biopolymer transport system component